MKVWEALVQSQVTFNRVPEKGGFSAEPGQVQQGSGKGSGEGVGGFGAEPGQFQQVAEKLWEALVQSQVRFNRSRFQRRVPGGFGAEPGQVQQRSGEGSGGVNDQKKY